MELNVRIWRRKNVVVAEIIEQADSLRRYGEIITDGEYYIDVDTRPDIEDKLLRIRGHNFHFDNNTVCHHFASEELAIEWCKRINKLIDRINDTGDQSADENFIKVR